MIIVWDVLKIMWIFILEVNQEIWKQYLRFAYYAFFSPKSTTDKLSNLKKFFHKVLKIRTNSD